MESTNDMLAWMDIAQSTIDKIRDTSPAWIFKQHLQVFYTTLAGDQEEASWLRNCSVSSFSDDTLLMHLKASICHYYDEYPSIHELMEEYDLSVLQMTDDSTVPKITVFKSRDSRHEMMHILTGAFMVHLVEEQSADAFETFAEHCRHQGPGLPIFAGHIHPKIDGGPEETHSPPPTERYPSYTDHGRAKRRMCVAQSANHP